MKKIFLLLFTILTLSCCSDDDNNTALPPATQTGAGTFACYVNGKPFIDKSGGWFNCFYQLVDGEYYFGIQGEDNNREPFSLNIGTLKKGITENATYYLTEYQEYNIFGGGYFKDPFPTGSGSNTNSEYTGELTITKLDFQNHIVSGIFWFDIQHPLTGERVQIREGRFDTLFAQ